MPRDFSPSVALAARLIDGFMETGAPLSQLVKKAKTGDGFDPTVTTQNNSCKAVVLSHSKMNVDGNLIKSTDKLIYLSTEGLSVVPELQDDFITPDGQRLTLVEPLKPLQPGSTIIFWELNGRA